MARMRPPEWPAFPTAEKFDLLYRVAPSSAIEAVRSNARALALMLKSVGVNVNALPLLDVRQEGATDIIGDRALGSEPMQVAALGRAVLDGMASAGVVGIIKHMPGHGRALVDSHKELPVVTATAEELESRPRAVRTALVGADGDDRPRRLRGLGFGAPRQPVADRHPRHHPGADRVRRLADERRSWDGGPSRRFREPGIGRRRGRVRRRASLFGQNGRDDGRGVGRPIAERGRPRADGARDGRDPDGARAARSPRKSPSAISCWRSPDPALVDGQWPFVDSIASRD